MSEISGNSALWLFTANRATHLASDLNILQIWLCKHDFPAIHCHVINFHLLAWHWIWQNIELYGSVQMLSRDFSMTNAVKTFVKMDSRYKKLYFFSRDDKFSFISDTSLPALIACVVKIHVNNRMLCRFINILAEPMYGLSSMTIVLRKCLSMSA